MLSVSALAACPCALAAALSCQETPQTRDARSELAETLRREGVWLDLERGVVSIPATVQVREDLLEYLLVAPNGSAHESLFLTTVEPSLLNAALLLLGVEPGHNAHFESQGEVRPEDERQGDRPRRRVYPPYGGGFFLHAAWREAGESYFFRVEDLIANLDTGRSLRRHRWVYLGSRFARLKPEEPEVFLADIEGNLVNLSFFFQGNTLVTASLEECLEQAIWVANAWLVPPRGEPVRLFFARGPMSGLEPAWAAELPEVKGMESEPPASTPTDGER